MRDKHCAEQATRLDDKYLDQLAGMRAAPSRIPLTLNGVPQHRLTLNGRPLTQLNWHGQRLDRRRHAAGTSPGVRLRRRDDIDLGFWSEQAPATLRQFEPATPSGHATPSASTATFQRERIHAIA